MKPWHGSIWCANFSGSFDSRSQRSKANHCAPLSANREDATVWWWFGFPVVSESFQDFWCFCCKLRWKSAKHQVLLMVPGAVLMPWRFEATEGSCGYVTFGALDEGFDKVRMKSEQKIRKTPLMIKANSEVESSTTLATHRNWNSFFGNISYNMLSLFCRIFRDADHAIEHSSTCKASTGVRHLGAFLWWRGWTPSRICMTCTHWSSW